MSAREPDLLWEWQIRGLPVRVERGALHAGLLVYLAVLALPLIDAAVGPGSACFILLAAPFVLLACVLAHETGHVLASRRLGVDVAEIRIHGGGGAHAEAYGRTARERVAILLGGPLATAGVLAALVALDMACGWPPGSYGPHGAAGDAAVFRLADVLRGTLAVGTLMNLTGLVLTVPPLGDNDGGLVLSELMRDHGDDFTVAWRRLLAAGVSAAVLIAGAATVLAAAYDARWVATAAVMLLALPELRRLRDDARLALVSNLPLRDLPRGQQLVWSDDARVDAVVHLMVFHLAADRQRMAVVDADGVFLGLVGGDELAAAEPEETLGSVVERATARPRDATVARGATTLREMLEDPLTGAAEPPRPPFALVDADGCFEGLVWSDCLREATDAQAHARLRPWQRLLLIGRRPHPVCEPLSLTPLDQDDEEPATAM